VAAAPPREARKRAAKTELIKTKITSLDGGRNRIHPRGDKGGPGQNEENPQEKTLYEKEKTGNEGW